MATCPTCLATYPDDTKNCSKDGATLVPDDAVPSSALELPPGQIVGEYSIEKKIGEGGFGAVYAASHPVIGKMAAIKILNPNFSHNPVMVQRFIAEARAANQIRHRGIIDIFGFGKLEDGRQYYIMELLEGMTLEAYLQERGRLRPSEALPILRQIARALDAAHGAGIVHRDLKPENVFLVFEEDRGVFPKLLDFGIAKLLGDSQQHKTRTGTPMGTPLYMSPEQCRGKQVDHRTDIYSFGVMTHCVLTGSPPFLGEDVMDVLMAQVQTPPPPMSSVCPDVEKQLDAPVLKMLAKDPAERPQTVSAAVDALVEAARAAGIEVPQIATRSSEKLPRVDVPRSLTPEQAVFAQADTMIQAEPTAAATTNPSPRTLPSQPDTPGKTNRWIGPALGAGLFVAGIVTTMLVMSSKGNPGEVTQAGAAPLVTTPAAPAAPASGEPAAPKPEVTVTPAATANVEVRFETTPANVEIFDGDKPLGKSPGPYSFPRGDKPISLRFSAAGYRAQLLDVKVNENRTETVNLEKEKELVKGAQVGPKPTATATAAGTGTGKRNEIEY